ncbi:MAG: PmoA family protein, partial [Rubrobacteraceae bacterium]|nr:PmoA family protein [Rubrobacteraceae bacterium]
MRLAHAVGEAVELCEGRDLLFRYVYESGVDPEESPKPYFHPLRTLAGEEVTLFRPHDHPWHTGLAMTSAYLSGENFWGGPTFVRDEGYAWLENQGRIRHEAWNEMHGDGPFLSERLSW